MIFGDMEKKVLRNCVAGIDIRSSDRAEDRAKQALRRHGFIAYVGKPRRWQASAKGVALVRLWNEGKA
jgi:hypothetical protein